MTGASAIGLKPAASALFKVAGGPSVGMGHVMRSLELAREIQGAGVRVAGFLCDDPRSREVIAASGFLLATNPDDDEIVAVVVDDPTAWSDFCPSTKLNHPGQLLIALDCSDMENAALDLVINLFNHHPKLRTPLASQTRYHEGAQFAIIRREFEILHDRTPAAAEQKILVTFGGADPRQHTLRVLAALAGNLPAGVRTEVIIGPSFPHRDEVLNAAARPGAVVHENVRDLAPLMHGSTLALSGGGTTMLELACLGVPTLVIPQTEEEVRFAGSFADRGAVKLCPMTIDADSLQREVLAVLTDASAREQMSRAGRSLVDGRGAQRIAELIAAEIAQARPLHA